MFTRKTVFNTYKGYLCTGKESTGKEKNQLEKVAFASLLELQQFILQFEAEVQASIQVQKLDESFDKLRLIRERNDRPVDFITIGQPMETKEEL